MNVYVIAASEHGPSKIGISRLPSVRLRALNTGNPLPLSLYHIEHIGIASVAVESAIKKSLASYRCEGGDEWFNMRPEQLRIAIRGASISAQILTNESSSLQDLQMKSAVARFSEIEKCRDYYFDLNENDPEDLDDLPFIGPLEVIAETISVPSSRRYNFKDYLLTLSDGMWLRWAFERLGKSMPSSQLLRPYLEADRFLQNQNATSAGNINQRYIEWSCGRDLSDDELLRLRSIWNKFVPLYNDIQVNGPQWETHGIDDHVDDVHLYCLNGDRDKGDKNYIVFVHAEFRAILLPSQRIDFLDSRRSIPGELRQLPDVPLRGFITPMFKAETWYQPFNPWLRDAPRRRDVALSQFLNKPEKRYPDRRSYDGPQPATIVCIDLPRIDEFGMY